MKKYHAFISHWQNRDISTEVELYLESLTTMGNTSADLNNVCRGR
jgi:hypothetical protein